MTLRHLAASTLVVVVATVSCAQDPTERVIRAPKPDRSPRHSRSIDAAASRPFRFLAIGDFGDGSESQRVVAQRMCRWRTNHPFRLVVTTGDNIYPSGEREHFQTNFFEPYACLFDKGVRFRASLGNHDVEANNGADELNEPAFGLRGRNYVIRRRGVRFIFVDGNDIQRRWLSRAVQTQRGDRWKIVVMHHPVYSSGNHGSTEEFHPWMPRLFERRGIDLVLQGHDHVYLLTKPIHRIRYVVTGGGGAGTGDCFPADFVERCDARYHFLDVRVGSRRIRVTAVPDWGPPFDVFRTRGRR